MGTCRDKGLEGPEKAAPLTRDCPIPPWKQSCERCREILDGIQDLPAGERLLPKLIFRVVNNLQNRCGRGSGGLQFNLPLIVAQCKVQIKCNSGDPGAGPGLGGLLKTFTLVAIVVVFVQSHLYNVRIRSVKSRETLGME